MPIKALIVDDSSTAREYIKYQLVKMGCVVAGEAANAADGLNLFRELAPDIVTLDLVMPPHETMNAMTALRAMKNETPDTVIIVVSAVSSSTSVKEFLREGVFDYIVKPLSQYSFNPLVPKLQKCFSELRSPDTLP